MKDRIIIRTSIIPKKLDNVELRLQEVLDHEDQKRIMTIDCEIIKKRLLMSRLLVRHILSELSNYEIKPYMWKFKRTLNGKLEIDTCSGLPNFSFSISYAGAIVAVAASNNKKVGIDIEEVPDNPIDISAALTNREIEYLEKLSPREKIRKLIRIWTIKEAYSKLLGLGFDRDFRTIEIIINKNINKNYQIKNSLHQIPAKLPDISCFSFFYKAREYLLTLCHQKILGIKSLPVRFDIQMMIEKSEQESISLKNFIF